MYSFIGRPLDISVGLRPVISILIPLSRWSRAEKAFFYSCAGSGRVLLKSKRRKRERRGREREKRERERRGRRASKVRDSVCVVCVCMYVCACKSLTLTKYPGRQILTQVGYFSVNNNNKKKNFRSLWLDTISVALPFWICVLLIRFSSCFTSPFGVVRSVCVCVAPISG